MTGEEIFNAYQLLRDFSGSESDTYAQDLMTALMVFGNEVVFSSLEEASSQNKKIFIVEDTDTDSEPFGIKII